jgi:hypothetical protein
MNTPPRSARLVKPLLCSLTMLLLLLAAPAHAQNFIKIKDGGTNIISSTTVVGGSVTISTNFTVTSGANVLIVVLANGKNNKQPPATLAWGGQTITNLVSGFGNAVGRQVTIYYLFSPTPGTQTITAAVAGDVGLAMQVYTLTYVDTSVPPLIASNYNAAAPGTPPALSATVSGVASSSWAVLASLTANSAGNITNSTSGGVVVNAQQQSGSTAVNATYCMGYASNLVSGSDTFTATVVAGSSKMMVIGAVFTPGVAPVTFPAVVKQPESLSVYAGGMVHFSVLANGTAPLGYQWLSNNVPLSGATNSTLTYGPGSANVVAGAAYTVVITNNLGSITSAVATVSIRTPTEPYEISVANLGPSAFYQLNETADPATTDGGATAFDNANSLNGIYGIAAQNGNATYNIAGPTPAAGYPGFTAANTASQSANGTANSTVTIPSLNLNTNAVTITAWIYPTIQFEPLGAGLVFNRDINFSSVIGLGYGPVDDASFNPALSYNWNNDPGTYGWISNLEPPQNTWSFVALVVTPTNATIYLLNANGIASASHNYPHLIQPFSGTTMIGGDPSGANRYFTGQIDDVAVFNKALTSSNLYSMFYAASGQTNYAPMIAAQPATQTIYNGQTGTFTVVGGGSSPLTYQWQADTGTGPTNINSGGQFTGADSATLTINKATNFNAGTYYVILSNLWGTATSSGAFLTVNSALGAATNITMSVQQAIGADWNTAGNWIDGQGGLPASVSAAALPGSTYELLAGSRMRTPVNSSVTTFPGNQLTVDGNGVWINNPGPGLPMAEIRLKENAQPVNAWIVNFPKLIMNGGQINLGPDGPYAGYITIGGELDLLANTPIYNNDAQGDNVGLYISAWLTGNGTVEHHADTTGSIPFNSLTNNLNIACATNTFTGTWNIASGILLGSAPGSLGTNTITIGSPTATNAALETAYDINNPNANLILYGKMFLHQNDAFRSVFINGVPLTNGVYSFATLASLYPANFPASWALQNGSSINTGSGQITVLSNAMPLITVQPANTVEYLGHPGPASFSVTAIGNPPLSYRWFTNGTVALSDNANRIGSSSNVLTIPIATAADLGSYTVVVTNGYGAVTSVVATLTSVPPGYRTSTNIATTTPSDWTVNADWQTNTAAPGTGTGATQIGTKSPIAYGNNYEMVSNGVAITSGAASPTVTFIRTPSVSVGGSTTFPTFSLTVDANTVLMYKANNNQADYFPNLVLNGGVVCKALGVTSTAIITGAVQVVHQSYLSSGSDGNRVSIPAVNGEAFTIAAALSGSGNLYIMNFLTNLPNIISGGVNNLGYHGTWIVQCGWLLGSNPGSLGTNSSVIVDPNDTLYQTDMPGVTASVGNALFQVGYAYNTAGTLVITNGGQMNLTTNCAFTAVTINGTSLGSGVHPYSELSANYPNNFLPGGSGSITIQAYNPLWPNTTPNAPHITSISVSGTSLSLSATNGTPGGPWTLLQSTNVALPLSQWETNRAGIFDGSGNLYTNIVNTATNSREFYLLKVQ